MLRPNADYAAQGALLSQFWIDVGCGLLTERKHRDQGLAALLEAEKLAPQKVRNNMFVRESSLACSPRPAARPEAVTFGAWPTGSA